MTKLLVSFIAAVVFAPSVTFAQDAADIFKSLDANGDGAITSDEVKADKKSAFERLLRARDGNKDGKLTREEFAGAANDERPANPQAGGDRPGQRPGRDFNPDRFFEMLDRNKDGKVTLEEVPEQAKLRLKPVFERLGKKELTKEDFAKLRPGGNAGKAPNPEELFKRFDANKDGKVAITEIPEQLRKRVGPLFERLGKKELTKEEFVRVAGRFFSRPGQPRGNQPGGEFEAQFKRMDKNGDGSLKGDEVPAGLRERVSKLDTNKDGALTLEELKKAFTLRGPRNRDKKPEK